MGLLIGIIVGLLLLYLIVLYNRLVSMRNRVREAFAAIDVYLQNRMDALTKIAQAVVAYAAHERDTLNEVTRLRTGWSDRTSIDEKLSVYAQMEKKLGGINVQAEQYPDLKANENYLHLQRTANDLEEKLSASRRTYNANVTSYNTKLEQFPTNVFAGMLGFRKETLLEIEQSKKQDVELQSLLRG